MSEGNWSGIGYNPAPGSVQATAELSTKLGKTARYLQETYEVLNGIKGDSEVWKGEASKAFASKIEDLPKYLNDANLSLDKASKHLGSWQDNLSGYQKRAHTLEDQARAARGQVAETEAALDKAKANPAFNLAGQRFDTDAELKEAEQRLASARAQADAAARKAEQAKVSLDEILRRAETLKDEHETTADETARKIQAADDGLAPPEPAWYEQLGEWIAEWSGTIGDIAGLVSAVAGALALIPVLAPVCGPIALAAGGVALAAHTIDNFANGKWDEAGGWATFIGDVAGLVPGYGAVRAAWSAGGDALSLLGKGDAVLAGAAAIGDKSMDASRVATVLAEKAFSPQLAETAAKAGQSVFNLGTQVPTVVEWGTEGDTQQTSKSAAGNISMFGNIAQAFP